MVEAVTLLDRYRLEDPVASGGMGRVFVATDERLGRQVAIKLLKEDLGDDPQFVERFRREARAVAGLNHPNIASVYDYGEDEGRHFIVMEFVEGRDLSEIIGAEGPLDPERGALVAAGTCDALGHAHDAGIVHRDMKPANIIVGRDDEVKVTDFGIARALGESTLTAAGTVLGTAHYLAPEQASGGEVGPAADQYAMGVVLYEMLTGDIPFGGTSPVGIAMRHVAEDVPPPSRVNAAVPSRLDQVVATATTKDPQQRYPSVSRMAQALRGSAPAMPPAEVASPAAATGPPGATQVLTETTWPERREGSGPRVAARAVLLGLALVALAALGLLVFRLVAADERGPGAPSAVPATDSTPETRASPSPPSESPPPSETPPAPELVVVPQLVGLDYKDAVKELEALGLAATKIVDDESRSDERPEMTIVVEKKEEQEPAPGGQPGGQP